MTHGSSGTVGLGTVFLLAVLSATVAYVAAAARESRQRRRSPWSAYRTALWLAGSAGIVVTLTGPVADLSRSDFVAHMVSHLLAGMVVPILWVCAAPVTLALRSLHVVPARRLTRLLRSRSARFVTHPVTAGLLVAGPTWVLYATPVGTQLLQSHLLHYVLVAHFLLAGYLFTSAIIPVDPAPHRASLPLRLVVLVAVSASHSVLSKYIYANPPVGTSAAEAQHAALWMYYGGDVLELVVLSILMNRWLRRRRDGGAARYGTGTSRKIRSVRPELRSYPR